jgi:DNA-binding MarR family transcriptional regulator
VSNSTISTTITKLWKEKKLVEKNILPENQRVTVVSLTKSGQKILDEIRQAQSITFKTVSKSLGLSSEQGEYFQLFLDNAIKFFDKELGLKLDRLAA